MSSTPVSYAGKDLKQALASFSPIATSVASIKIKNVEPIASYSWVTADVPTIAVPGSPNLWTNLNPRRVPQDHGIVFVDQNAEHVGPEISPLAPVFCAVDDMHKSAYDYKSLDLVTDRNNLRKLIRWTNKTGDKDFRIDIQRAGKTCLFTRREPNNTEEVVGFRGFGREYQKAATKPARGLETTDGHHRIISMDLDGLKVLLRFTAEAYVVDPTEDDDFTAAFASLGIRSEEQPKTSIPGLNITHAGPRTLVTQSSLIEIKTRVSHRPPDWDDIYPQLYLSQTPHLYIAKHTRGEFGVPEKHQLTASNMRANTSRAEKSMAKLKAVLDEILAAVQKREVGTELSLVCIAGKLQLYERVPGTGKSVGTEILSKFE